MEIRNNLSKNLKEYQQTRDSSLAEFSAELGIPKSTLRSIMRDGNTTLDTAIRLAEGLGVSLDELVYERRLPEKISLAQLLLRRSRWYVELPEEKRATVAFHIDELLKVVAE